MSSFKRKTRTTASCPVGFYPSIYNGLSVTSTGIASLDDLIGGGLPISSSFIVDEDVDSAYAQLVLRYWIAQGLACSQRVIVVGSSLDVGGDPACIIDNLMPLAASVEEFVEPPHPHATGEPTGLTDSEEDDASKNPEDQQMKIAWRYESLGRRSKEAGQHDHFGHEILGLTLTTLK